ncbi:MULTISPECIES: PP2C family serine/threonine-protein phosphatase [Gammaproteobacteria]|uniref:PP2C family protein-serine/threonine phosphatase n=1 Tax=Gammaproteobacteria TaxID=1236 RepID=UPI000DD0D14F|nr:MULTISPECIES: protein phosphatase 2C domain-containing protein [Gammaproteobacteria]RTE87232.1 serine/threonine-protein phosphatase [Aliidiomarina sp. B3213]TCZ92980.1 serine/threonine-protein phosphatase [Lysobacter sp. N42]
MLIRSRHEETADQRAEYNDTLSNLGSLSVITDRGGRSENQDAWGVCTTASGGYFFIVADGLGGHKGGRIAAQAAIEGVQQYAQGIEGSIISESVIRDAFQHAQNSIRQQQQELPDLDSMRSTLVILAIEDGHAMWGHIGDVRLYLFNQQGVEFQTKDQSVPQLMVDTGEIQLEEIRNHPDRSRLLQALGRPDDSYKIRVSDEIKQLNSECSFLLCTDGFWEWVVESQMHEAIDSDNVLGTMNTLEHFLREKAEKHEEDFDNYTFLLLKCSNLDAQGSKWSATRLVSSFFKPKAKR